MKSTTAKYYYVENQEMIRCKVVVLETNEEKSLIVCEGEVFYVPNENLEL